MPKIETVITALAICTGKCKCFGCWYGQNKHDFRCQDRLKEDALSLLREHKPVVLCGDCKYWNAGTCLNDNVSRQIEDCGCYPDFVTDSKWFCAEGERR